MNDQLDFKDQLDDEVFVCQDCGKQCKAVDGTWPRQDVDGNWIVTTDDEYGWCMDRFVCYDCAP